MAQETTDPRRPRSWIILIGIVILLIFLYFYQPFEVFLDKSVRGISSTTIIFWFASLVAVLGYAVAHWQSFRQNIFRGVTSLEAEGLVFDTLQIAILIAVIFFAGATLQAVGILGEHLINRGAIIDPVFGRRLLSIILLVILAVLFYLLHHVVRAFRTGRRPGRPPPRVAGRGQG